MSVSIPIVECSYLPVERVWVQDRFPRSKRRRIRRKWAKLKRNGHEEEREVVFFLDGAVLASPEVIGVLTNVGSP